MTDFIFLSVAFGDQYIEQQKRLDESITRIHPDAEHIMWTNNYPPGARTHKESLYGFKPHAVAALLDAGYKKIIWLDTAIVLQHPVYYWFSLGIPLVAAKDDNALSKTICDKALNYYSNPNIEGMNLVGGSVYVFDFNNLNTHRIFTKWLIAEMDGQFGSQTEQSAGLINRHRHDEAILAYLMQSNGVQPLSHDIMRYNQDENSIVRKYHFK